MKGKYFLAGLTASTFLLGACSLNIGLPGGDDENSNNNKQEQKKDNDSDSGKNLTILKNLEMNLIIKSIHQQMIMRKTIAMTQMEILKLVESI